jgi:hypothetical protein
MDEGGSFYGVPARRGRRRDGLAAVAVVLVVVGIGLAIAKPWGDGGLPAASGAPAVAAASPSPAASPASPTPKALPTYRPHPLPVAFAADPPPRSDAWAGLDWRRLAPDDPLGAVRAQVTTLRTAVAIGDIQGTTSTTVWSSVDGVQWQPVDSGSSTGFWPGITIVGLATVGTRFVAVTEMVDYTTKYVPPVMSWTSADGRVWTPVATLPVESFTSPTGSPPLVAAGATGLVIATSGLGTQVATSPDGVHWAIRPPNTLPASFALVDLHSSANGYVAVGWMRKAHGGSVAASLWSADGRTWLKTPAVLPTPASGSGTPANSAVSLTVGDQGMIAVGIGGSPGAAMWWRSPDGRHWEPLPTFPPLGATTCGGANCGLQPNGTLIADGHRLVAMRGGPDAVALVSADGLQWTALELSGDIPSAEATLATLLPGGVLVSDGTTTWYGQAESR